jgi:endonuclease/exonuclease/phosphatase (EEP) superfamily protein YafD
MSAGALRRFASQRLAVLSVLVAFASALSLAGRWHWFADLFAHFVPHYFVAASVLFGLHLWLRQFPWAVLGLVVAAGNGALLSPYLLPRAAMDAGGGTPVRIFQFNLSRSNPAPLAALGYLRSLPAPPDVAIFLEATPAWTSSLHVMKDDYSTIAKLPRRDNFGMAVLSRLPGTEVAFRESGQPPVPLIVLTARVDGKAVRIYAAHPPPPLGGLLSHARNVQLASMAEEIERSDHRYVIVAGDLNATPWSHAVGAFFKDAGMRDAQRGFGYLPTWAPPPLSRWLGIPIDLTLVSRDIQVSARDAGPWLGSDHWPVLTTVTLR